MVIMLRLNVFILSDTLRDKQQRGRKKPTGEEVRKRSYWCHRFMDSLYWVTVITSVFSGSWVLLWRCIWVQWSADLWWHESVQTHPEGTLKSAETWWHLDLIIKWPYPDPLTLNICSVIMFTYWAEYLQAITALGFKQPTPIQKACVPVGLLGRDLCACAATGTGDSDILGPIHHI